jgi:hypothetical protein
MARNTTLLRLLDLYRAECRLSLNPAHNAQVRDTQVSHLQRMQDWLWSDFNWPILIVERFLTTQDGQRFYGPPDDVRIDRIVSMAIKRDDAYFPLLAGIDDAHYAAYDSEKDERQWPPQRWKISEDERIEIWPIPDTNYDPVSQEGRIKVRGVRNLQPLVDDDHRADLDDRLIVLFCAAEHLASQGAKDASLKQNQALAHYAKLRGAQLPRKKFTMFSEPPRGAVQRVPIAVYNKPSS